MTEIGLVTLVITGYRSSFFGVILPTQLPYYYGLA